MTIINCRRNESSARSSKAPNLWLRNPLLQRSMVRNRSA